ncbi:MAG: ribosome assembly RNA-binding protein YhbY [Chromatiales bacterium]|nr:ribosome assembly RNA-binding protein YhbY [Chromatiales bacterium]
MHLDAKQKRYLRGLAASLKPVVTVGQGGLSEAVMRELELSLEHHELLKIRLSGVERDDKAAMIEQVCRDTDAALVQTIGHVAVLYRPNPKKPRVSLPKNL